MIARLEKWYKGRSRPQRLLFILCSNWIFWFISWRIGKWIFEDPITLRDNLLYASFMAVWMTLIFRFRTIIKILKPKRSNP